MFSVGPFRFSVKPGVLSALAGGAVRVETGSRSPESGCEVSAVVEKLSRKIHRGTTKYLAEVVESVYP